MLVRPELNSQPPAWQPGAQPTEPPVRGENKWTHSSKQVTHMKPWIWNNLFLQVYGCQLIRKPSIYFIIWESRNSPSLFRGSQFPPCILRRKRFFLSSNSTVTLLFVILRTSYKNKLIASFINSLSGAGSLRDYQKRGPSPWIANVVRRAGGFLF